MDTPNEKLKEKTLLDKIKRRDKKKRPTMKVDSGKLKELQKIIRKKA